MATRINFKELRRQLSFENILAHYNVTLKAKGDQRQGFCPLPTHEGTRNSPSFSANVAKGIWQCFGCGASGNLMEFAAHMEGLDPDNPQDFRQAALLLAKRYDGFDGRKEKEKEPVTVPEPEKGGVDGGREVKRCTDTSTNVNVPLDFELTSLDFTHPYLRDRGFRDETIRAFGLGYCNRGLMKGRIAIPLHDQNGALIGYAGRVVDDTTINEDTPRYLFPSSRERKGERYEFRKSEFLYNGFRVKDVCDLVVVESFTALWWLAQAGIAHVVALMGASCSERQAELVKELVLEDGRIWVLADGDPAGERMAESAMKLLAPHRFVRWVKLDEGQQPTDLSVEQLRTIMNVTVDSTGGMMTEPRNYFSGEAARALVGTRIRTLVEFSGVPKGTTGKVTRADPTADADNYNVGIEWDMPERSKPLVDWFSRDEYYRFLEEI